MNDPFFDEDDDGDFDDLYSAAPRREQAPAAPTAATNRHPSKDQAPEHAAGTWDSVDGVAYSYSVSPASSVPSTTTSRSGAGAKANHQQQQRQTLSTTTKRTKQASAPRNSSADAMRPSKPMRRKGSEELFNVDWEDDGAVTACFQCNSSFSLLKRKHHCRHCGRVMCSDCSVFRYFDVSRKKHRVCNACNTVLARANRLHDSDVESLERSGATGDDGAGAGSTRASTKAAGKAKKPRGKLHENLKKTFASKDAKQKKAKTPTSSASAATADAPVSTSAAVQATESTRATDARSRNPSDDLFDVTDDTWFTDPQDGENSKPKHSHRRDLDDHVDTERHTIATAAPTSAASWQSRGPQPQPTALSIDVYASRDPDVLAQQRPVRMEMPRPVAHVVPIASTLAPREPSTQLRASTYDGDASFASRPSARVTGPAQPTVFTAVRPTFYDANADDLVVDDAPGYYAHSDSYSLVEAPGDSGGSHETPVTPAAAAAGTTTSEKHSSEPPHDPNARGFTGALKRLFGISGAKSSGKASSQTQSHHESSAGAAPASVSSQDAPRPSLAIERMASDPRRVSSAANVLGSQSTDRDLSSGVPRVGSFDRYSMAERSFVSSRAAGERYSIAESTSTTFTATAASTVLSSSRGFRHDDAAPSHVATISDTFASREASTRPRRDTFDDLFASPTSQATGTSGTSALSSRAWDGVRSTLAMPATGVDRFDRQRRDEEGDAVDRTPALNSLTPGVYSITRSRSSSIGLGESALGASRVTTSTVDSARAPPTSWRSVTPEANYGVATYAVPSSIGTDRFATSSQVRQDGTQDAVASSASTSIMDDLHRRTSGSAVRSKERASSVDDIFAAFERPNEYVFDAATGGYVATTTTAATRSYNSVAPQSSPSYETSVHVRASRSERREDRGERRNGDASSQRRETREPAMARDIDDDALDDTIVDKISSLEDELATLKRLIRQRKDHEPSSASAVRRRPTEAASSTRKLSIFDHDSSSEDDDRTGRRTSTRRATRSKAMSSAATGSAELVVASPAQTQRKPKTKTKTKKRRDSFADLFEDSPTQGAAALGGGYESLFQTGTGKDNGSSGSSDEHERTHRQRLDKTARRTSATASRKTRSNASSESDSPTRSYQTPSSVMATAQDNEEEEEYPSLKNRSRGSVTTRSTTTKPSSSRAKTTTSAGIFSDSDDDEDVAAASVSVTSVRASVKTTTVARSAPKATKAKRSDVDAIDALFDDSSDRDVAQFFSDDAQSSGSKDPSSSSLAQSPAQDPTADASDASDVESNDAIPSTTTIANAQATPSDEALAADANDSDEEFARSLATAKKRRSKTESLQLAATEALAPAPSTTTAVDLFAVSPDLTECDSAVDSDDEFASLLAANRTTDTTPALHALEPAVTVALAPEAALKSVAAGKDDTGADEASGVLDDMPAQPKAAKASRGKSVSFFDQQSERTIAVSENQNNGAGEDSDNNENEEKTLATEAVAGIETMWSVGSDAVDAPAAAAVAVTESLKSEAAPVDESTLRTSDADLDSSLQRQDSATAPRVPKMSAVVTPAARLHNNDDDDDDVMMGLFDASSDLYSAALGSSSLPSAAAVLNKSRNDSEDDDSDVGAHSDNDEPAFSFEVKRKPKRATPPALSLLDLAVPARRAIAAADDDDSAVLMLGKYASVSAPVASPLHHTDATTNSSSTETTTALSASAESLESLDLSSSSSSVTLPLDDRSADADWQQLQEQERARRKKLQLKQRQAQRDKLKKQSGGGGSSRQVVTGATDASSSTSEKKTKTKKSSKSKDLRSPDGDNDDDAARRKRSSTSSSRKHKHKHKSHHPTSEHSKENIDASSSARTEL